jgi:DNA topoisomerase-3
LLILTEKSSVARDFALALDCHQKGAVYSGGNIVITYCQGHLFGLHEPNHYSAEYYVFPDKFEYFIKSETKKQAELVIDLIKKNYKTSILIATDADREGEVIARECLLMAGVSDISRIKRFWVSQALTRQVIVDGIKNARPLADYNGLADQGFARQHADWLVGINCSRYIKSVVNARVSVGRVQTALLNAISLRNEEIENFKKEKYFEHYGIFDRSGNSVTAIYCEKNKTSFPDDSLKNNLQQFVGKKFSLKDKSIENKTLPPPQLYNLTALQKDAYNQFSYTAETTLAILQELYEDLKCVSYPRTPSRVMGS